MTDVCTNINFCKYKSFFLVTNNFKLGGFFLRGTLKSSASLIVLNERLKFPLILICPNLLTMLARYFEKAICGRTTALHACRYIIQNYSTIKKFRCKNCHCLWIQTVTPTWFIAIFPTSVWDRHSIVLQIILKFSDVKYYTISNIFLLMF